MFIGTELPVGDLLTSNRAINVGVGMLLITWISLVFFFFFFLALDKAAFEKPSLPSVTLITLLVN